MFSATAATRVKPQVPSTRESSHTTGGASAVWTPLMVGLRKKRKRRESGDGGTNKILAAPLRAKKGSKTTTDQILTVLLQKGIGSRDDLWDFYEQLQGLPAEGVQGYCQGVDQGCRAHEAE
jgi:hypothetical protein